MVLLDSTGKLFRKDDCKQGGTEIKRRKSYHKLIKDEASEKNKKGGEEEKRRREIKNERRLPPAK